jgi:hypothetical protein
MSLSRTDLPKVGRRETQPHNPMVEGFGNALTRTNAGIKTIQEYANRLCAGVQEQREWLQEVADIIHDIQEKLNALMDR